MEQCVSSARARQPHVCTAEDRGRGASGKPVPPHPRLEKITTFSGLARIAGPFRSDAVALIVGNKIDDLFS
jgi:hypothetical protein